MPAATSSHTTGSAAARLACRLCTVHLSADVDDIDRRICASCKRRPEAGGSTPVATKPAAAPAPVFTPAERALIRSLHASLPALDLLRLLNIRRIADHGPEAARHSIERLQAEIQAIATPQGDTWSSLRRLLSEARRSGTITKITPSVIDDFAVVFQLSPAQVTHLRDVLAHAKEIV